MLHFQFRCLLLLLFGHYSLSAVSFSYVAAELALATEVQSSFGFVIVLTTLQIDEGSRVGIQRGMNTDHHLVFR